MEHVRMDLVSVSVPDLPTLFPPGLRIANRRIYARLHSENAANWYKEGKLRYNFSYAEQPLLKWAGGLQRAAGQNLADDALIFFNNCVTTQAIENARRLRELLTDSPEVRVIEPAAPRQASLFGDG
jgi:uncharacterized protein YecE (DUF72 family)